MQQASDMAARAGRAMALCRLLLWCFAVFALAEVPLGTGLQSFASGLPSSVSATADVGDERSVQIAVLAQPPAETADDDRDPLAGQPSVSIDDHPALPGLLGFVTGTPEPVFFISRPAFILTRGSLELPLARGPPALA